MDVLKQLESKLQTLVQQRNALKEEVDQLRAAQGNQGQELEDLRAQLSTAQGEVAALREEREGVRKDVEAILRLVEGTE